MATEQEEFRTEPTVPNSSEFQAVGPGRPPSATNDELIAAGMRFHAETGRIPRIDDIVHAVGGAQRSRAAQARRAVAKRVADQHAAQWVNVSPAFEVAVRRLLGEFTSAAEASVVDQIEARVAKTDHELLDLKAVANSAAAQATRLEKDKQVLEDQVIRLSEDLDAMRQSLQRARQNARRYKTQAEERKHALDLLTHRQTRD